MKKILAIVLSVFVSLALAAQTSYCDYVDPKIGVGGAGCCTMGPSRPFGMVKPGVNCGPNSSSGWREQPELCDGFAQVHMCGAGGGPKYGNVMIQPFTGSLDATSHRYFRTEEDASLGYCSVTYGREGIKTEFSSAERSVIYRLSYLEETDRNLSVDCGFHLGVSNFIDESENQALVGTEIEVLSDTEVRGYSRVRGGWNRGAAYTIYFYLISDTPFAEVKTWKDDSISPDRSRHDDGKPVGALLKFSDGKGCVHVKIGISNLGCLRARYNVEKEIPHWSLERTVAESRNAWEPLLGRIEIDPATPDSLKRMFYTGLYHTMMHPTDKTGECPLWNDDVPYYDDYFALWDTYRTSYPMFNLVYPDLSSKMLQSMLTIFKMQGYVPDGRSGHWNGRTQGGSNSNIIFADAFLKGVDGVDWELALQTALKDADVPPGDNEEQHGRGALLEYNSLGYVPYGKARSCSRTVDYSICDYSIHLLAKGLGKTRIAERFLQQSLNWKNLWRDVEDDGARGFIMPRRADGSWVDTLYSDNPGIRDLPVTPHMTFSEEWQFVYYWGTSFYEGTSWQYSLAIPHNVPEIIGLSGGEDAFESRLDTFFGHGYFDVSNEPSFLIPCLYHWIGKPWKTSDCVRDHVLSKFSDRIDGIPGNDDTGAMSSWLDFHILGLYPIAGQDIYLIYSPRVSHSILHLPSGDFTIRAEKLSEKNKYIQSATLNGHPYPYSTLRHGDIAQGGELVLKMGPGPSSWGSQMKPNEYR